LLRSEPGLTALLHRRELFGDRRGAHGARRAPKRPPPDSPLGAGSDSSSSTHGGGAFGPPSAAAAAAAFGEPFGRPGSRGGSAELPGTSGDAGGDASVDTWEDATHQRAAAVEAAGVGAQLERWAEGDFLRHCAAAYCPLTPAPRSTIDLDFSPDGRLLASSQCVFLTALQSTTATDIRF